MMTPEQKKALADSHRKALKRHKGKRDLNHKMSTRKPIIYSDVDGAPTAEFRTTVGGKQKIQKKSTPPMRRWG